MISQSGPGVGVFRPMIGLYIGWGLGQTQQILDNLHSCQLEKFVLCDSASILVSVFEMWGYLLATTLQPKPRSQRLTVTFHCKY